MARNVEPLSVSQRYEIRRRFAKSFSNEAVSPANRSDRVRRSHVLHGCETVPAENRVKRTGSRQF